MWLLLDSGHLGPATLCLVCTRPGGQSCPGPGRPGAQQEVGATGQLTCACSGTSRRPYLTPHTDTRDSDSSPYTDPGTPSPRCPQLHHPEPFPTCSTCLWDLALGEVQRWYLHGHADASVGNSRLGAGKTRPRGQALRCAVPEGRVQVAGAGRHFSLLLSRGKVQNTAAQSARRGLRSQTGLRTPQYSSWVRSSWLSHHHG